MQDPFAAPIDPYNAIPTVHRKKFLECKDDDSYDDRKARLARRRRNSEYGERSSSRGRPRKKARRSVEEESVRC